jgi:hypothetical protein
MNPTRCYHLRAHILCHKVRLSFWVETDVELDHQPDIDEAERLLLPVGEKLVSSLGGDGSPFELDEFKITYK